MGIASRPNVAVHGNWILDGSNNFEDRHICGPAMEDLLLNLNNPSVMLWQIYQIKSGGWLDKNPNHGIGAQGGFLGGLNAVHSVMYTCERRDPLFIRVTVDGVSCGHQPYNR